MDLTGDEIAGVVDLFGTLEREELSRALAELSFRRGEEVDDERIDTAIDGAVAEFALVPVDGRLVVGPAAFPTLPEAGEDLPHILDAERRSVDREAAARSAESRFRETVETAIGAGDSDRLRDLLEVSYDLEAWGPVEVGDVREAIDRELTANC